jgi:hypothetical protein
MRALPPVVALLLLTRLPTAAAVAACGPGSADEVAAARAAVEAECDCTGAPSRGTYLRCAATVADRAVVAGTRPGECRRTIVRCAARSTCGRPGAVACCRTTTSGRAVCTVRADPGLCVPPAQVLQSSSCCDGCPGRPATCPSGGERCGRDADCPLGYGCLAGECRGGACARRRDCPAGGDCVFSGETVGVCVCAGCRGLGCPLGCSDAPFSPGCVCASRDDCPTENDVCFRGRCS